MQGRCAAARGRAVRAVARVPGPGAARGSGRLRLGLGGRPPALRPPRTGRRVGRTKRGRRWRRSRRSPSGSRSGRWSRPPASTRRRCWRSRPRRSTRSPAAGSSWALGAGWNRREFDAFGFPYDRRVSRFEEALAIIVPLLREGRTTFHGQFYDVDDCVLDPRPDATGRPADHAGLEQPAHAEHRSAGRGRLERVVEHLRQLGRTLRTGQGRSRRGRASWAARSRRRAAVLVTLPGGRAG